AVGRTREEHAFVHDYAVDRVVMDLRLQRRIVVADLAAGAPVGPHVGYLRRDVLLAAVELDALDAVGTHERRDLVAPPRLCRRVRDVHDEARPADVHAVRRTAGTRYEVAERLGLDAVVPRRVPARPHAAPDHQVIATSLQRLQHRVGVGQADLVPRPPPEAVLAREHPPA